MKIIEINSPKYGKKEVMVDDVDYEDLIRYKWSVYLSHNTFYARRNPRIGKRSLNKRNTILMARYIMKITDGSILVDHKDHNGLNNQKYNLRPCTKGQNNKNLTSHKNSSSKYLGVNLITKKSTPTSKPVKYWRASIRVNRKLIYLKTFKATIEGEKKAAKIYDQAAKKYHGEFGNLNFK